LGQKSSDYSAVPLCGAHHRSGRDSYHKLGPRRFSQRHNLDLTALVRLLNQKPMIRIHGGRFVGHFEDQQFVLGGTQEGIAPAVRKMVQLAHEDRAAQICRRVPA
jgi:hypothetical protein